VLHNSHERYITYRIGFLSSLNNNFVRRKPLFDRQRSPTPIIDFMSVEGDQQFGFFDPASIIDCAVLPQYRDR
jgi:hypothetical protein